MNKNTSLGKDEAESEEVGKFAQAKSRLASHPDTDPETLAKLADHRSADVVQRVAENAQTHADTLVKLSEHEDSAVRTAVTENRNTPGETLKTLSEDENPDVRYRVASNAKTPVDMLETLKDDDNPYVGARAQRTLKNVKSVAQRADELLLAEKFSEAEQLYLELLSGLESLIGANHPEVAEAKHKLAAALSGQGRTEDAMVQEEEAQKIREAIKALSA